MITILQMALKNRYDGVDKTALMRTLKGVSYKDLENLCNQMENDGLVNIDWFEMNDFVVLITQQGIDFLEDPNRVVEQEDSKQMFQCPLCETIVSEDATRCNNCGAEFEV